MTRQNRSAPPPIRRLDPQDPTPARDRAGARAATFVAAKRSIAAPQFSIRRMEVDKVSIHYGAKEAVKSVSLPIRQGEVLALIGPSGCGKTTLLRSLNRLTELTAAAKLTGSIRLDDVDIRLIEPTLLRRRVTMVFQQPNPFPMAIFDNIAYVLREQGSRRMKKKVLEPQVHSALAAGGAVRGGQRQPRPPGAETLRRPAAAALHRPGARRRTRGAAARRALLGARPAVDRGDRGPDRETARRRRRS